MIELNVPTMRQQLKGHYLNFIVRKPNAASIIRMDNVLELVTPQHITLPMISRATTPDKVLAPHANIYNRNINSILKYNNNPASTSHRQLDQFHTHVSTSP